VSEALDVRAALARLPQTDRAVLVLQAYEDRKLHDIAALLQCSLSATKSRLLRARARFRQVYRGGGALPPASHP
jgi:RNA polymerase sigma-70 factor (ECF subfamily)